MPLWQFTIGAVIAILLAMLFTFQRLLLWKYTGEFECQDSMTNNCTQLCTRTISHIDGINSYKCSCNAGYIYINDTNLCDGIICLDETLVSIITFMI